MLPFSPAQAVDAKGNASKHSSPLSAATCLGIASLLWLINFTPLQYPSLVLKGNAVLSQDRFLALKSLSQSHSLDSKLVTWVTLDSEPTSSATSSSPIQTPQAYRSLRIRVGLRHPVSMSEIESEIERLTKTAPTRVSGQTAPQKLHRQRWQLQAAEHALARFDLDRRRELEAARADENDTPFRLISRSRVSLTPEQQTLRDALIESIETAKRALELDPSAPTPSTNTSGSIAFTGAPVLQARGGRLVWIHGVLLGCVGIVIVSRPIRSVLAFSDWSHRSHRERDAKVGAITSTAPNMGILLRVLKKLEVHYLGEFVMACHREGAGVHSSDVPQRAFPSDQNHPRSLRKTARRWLSTRCLAMMSDGLLLLWVTLFVLRFVGDQLWRELLFRAPLAALSSVLSGI